VVGDLGDVFPVDVVATNLGIPLLQGPMEDSVSFKAEAVFENAESRAEVHEGGCGLEGETAWVYGPASDMKTLLLFRNSKFRSERFVQLNESLRDNVVLQAVAVVRLLKWQCDDQAQLPKSRQMML
jgi:hypothetical protein